jgi:colicin import membrane protein
MSKLTIRVRSAVRAGLLGVLVAGAARPAAAASADDAERAQIAAERAAIEARYEARERECTQRFVVTSCVDDAKRERREGLDVLKARQLALDEARRRARAAERSSELAAKAAEDAKRERAAHAAAASAPAVRHDDAASAVPRLAIPRDRRGAASAPAAKSSAAESAAERQAREARNRAAFEARQRQAAQHREEVLDNATRQMNERAPAASLPVPAAVPEATAASPVRR